MCALLLIPGDSWSCLIIACIHEVALLPEAKQQFVSGSDTETALLVLVLRCFPVTLQSGRLIVACRSPMRGHTGAVAQSESVIGHSIRVLLRNSDRHCSLVVNVTPQLALE